MRQTPDVQHVAVDCADEHAVVVQFIKNVNPQWTREGTDDEIAGEIERHAAMWPEAWKPIKGWRRIDAAEANAIGMSMRAKQRAAKQAARRIIPISTSSDEETVRRLEAAAAQVNSAAIATADVEQIKADARDLATVVQELASIVSVLRMRPDNDGEPPPASIDLSGIEADIKALSEQIAAYGELHGETARRLGDIEGGLSGAIARLDDLFAWHDRLAAQINTLASYRPDRRTTPPADLPPPPPTGIMQHSWVKGLADINENDPLPEGPQMPQDGHENEPASDHAQQVNVVRETSGSPGTPNQRLTIEETRNLTVEDRWAKPFARYQIAQQAVNGSASARHLLQGSAERRGVTIEALAQQIIAEWKQTEQDIMAEY